MVCEKSAEHVLKHAYADDSRFSTQSLKVAKREFQMCTLLVFLQVAVVAQVARQLSAMRINSEK